MLPPMLVGSCRIADRQFGVVGTSSSLRLGVGIAVVTDGWWWACRHRHRAAGAGAERRCHH